MEIRRAVLHATVAVGLFVTSGCNVISGMVGNQPAAREGAAGAESPAGGSAGVPVTAPASGFASTPIGVNALYAANDGKASYGGVTQVKVTVAPKSDPGISVSFPQSEVQGTGAQWQTSAWSAAVTAALLLGVDPNRFSFSYAGQGRFDGPSAGALMTVGTLAALLGHDIPKDFAMTGTINPDGSVGPVGGIPHKIDGAAKAGVKTLLVPIGQRSDYDENERRSVDLVQRGESQGVKVQLVANVFEAYQLATGKELPQPKGGMRPSLPSKVYDRMRPAASAWLAKVAQYQLQFEALPAEVRRVFQEAVAPAEEHVRAANSALREGAVSVAYEEAVSAALWALPNLRKASMWNAFRTQGSNAALTQVAASFTALQSLSALKDRFNTELPQTASGAVSFLDAYSNFVTASAEAEAAERELAYLKNRAATMKADDVVARLGSAVHHAATAEVFIEIANNEMAMFLDQGTGSPPSVQVLAALGDMLRRAGEATIAAFEAVYVSPNAQAYNVRDEVFKDVLMESDSDYLLAAYSVGHGISRTGNDAASAYAALGSGLNSYALGMKLMSKYYSLAAEVDQGGRVTSYGRLGALDNMLRLAERRADDLLGTSKEPALPALYYADNAPRFRNDADPDRKMSALFYYWQAAILSSVMANLTGEYAQRIQPGLQATSPNAAFLAANGFRP